MATNEQVFNEIEAAFGQVPTWLRDVPELALSSLWGTMRDFYLAETPWTTVTRVSTAPAPPAIVWGMDEGEGVAGCHQSLLITPVTLPRIRGSRVRMGCISPTCCQRPSRPAASPAGRPAPSA